MNQAHKILRIAIPSPLRRSFDYLFPEGKTAPGLVPGIRIKVPLRNKTTVGVLLEVSDTTTVPFNKLKRAEAILDTQPLIPPTLMQLTRWAADYYHHPIGEVVLSCLPTLLRQGRQVPQLTTTAKKAANQNPVNLNADQKLAIETINQVKDFQTLLLDGITGSGKTEVYLQAIAQKIQAQQQALILVPEIGLTPQTIARFEQRFNVPIAVLHSGLNDRERLEAWQLAASGLAPIVIGTRSAIFTPLARPGIIILDEEHDPSFKQQSGFRYSARDLAIVRGRLENIPVVLGSATPALETLFNAEKRRFHYLNLPARAGNAVPPKLHLLNIRNQSLDAGLSTPLIDAMHQHLAQGNQVLLFLNRRGYAPTLLCHNCGWINTCPRCDARLTLHQKPLHLVCHHCLSTFNVPNQCGNCKSSALLHVGVGTERVEQALTRHFPNISAVRIDRDSTRRKGKLHELLETIHTGESRILLGTQMLTKGHHFPNVTMVGILDADGSLFSSDFRASERMGQLIIQVAGRAGRADRLGEVYIQTHHPDHPLLQQLVHHDYQKFSQQLLQERQQANFPPFAYLAILRAEALTQNAPLHFLDHAKALAQEINNNGVQLLGPVPALMERKAGRFRAQLMLQATQRQALQNLLKPLILQLEQYKNKGKVRWSLDVDPLEIM